MGTRCTLRCSSDTGEFVDSMDEEGSDISLAESSRFSAVSPTSACPT
jgi:hypothetical protein